MQKTHVQNPGKVFTPGFSTIDCRRVVPSRSSADKQGVSGEHCDLTSLPAFGSKWVLVETKGDPPRQCSGQSIEYDPLTQTIYCAYGTNVNESYSSQFWKYSLQDNTWSRLIVSNATPHANCGSTLFNNKLWFFGGLSSPKVPVGDLHYLDLKTLEIIHPETSGPSPNPCANPLMMSSPPYIIVLAHTSASDPSTIHLLNTDTLEWQMITTDCIFRQGAWGSIVGSNLYIFGLSIPKTVLKLNLLDLQIKVLPTTGSEPLKLDTLATVSPGSVIFAFETLGAESRTRLFVFDCDRAVWYCYSLDYKIEEIENTSPKSIFYIESRRTLIAVWESDDDTKQPLAELPVGSSLSVIHLKLDILKMLK
ncbi:Kelch motif family protein [Histomonas meleagridis]|uniref:Kelch motif family protein n=1 Tax=Histomonas meleagridis TaxID=135588 RepID=UPI003559B518|nr:Kelch motif family protein [Histomonas meleagridis]KAH0798139.1 Kelch motif family protein [Histomonas meleagridis]